MPRVTICSTVWEFEKLRSRWESICNNSRYTIFQDFDWNLLAARIFHDRETLFIVCAEASYGLAIIPAVRRTADGTLRLLGEELFDYRTFLANGDSSEPLLRIALSSLAQTQQSLEVVAVRESDRMTFMVDPCCRREGGEADQEPVGEILSGSEGTRGRYSATSTLKGGQKPAKNLLSLFPFTEAPLVDRTEMSAEQFTATHNRLGRNIRRFQRLGFEVKTYDGSHSELLRNIYTKKAAQSTDSLFRDSARVEFIIQAAGREPQCCKVFVLECGSQLAAALVTFQDGDVRRFYTGLFDRDYEKLSPAMSLIYEATRQSLAAGLNCDYMTGTQPYKLRLATGSMPLYRLQATPEQLAALAEQIAA
ncbi:MAG TPA: GNAT family N-acetyltransferase [Candidatus Angelobacter sp.]|nr:GNAT family N-acetyltransferase [Candidatus Angelobacter sp.]